MSTTKDVLAKMEELSVILARKTENNGVELPELTNPGDAGKLLEGYQLIDQAGAVVEGTIAERSASDLTASGAAVTVPAGHYPSQVSKSVASATQATPTIAVSSNGLITASVTQGAGYVEAGTKSATKQLTVQAAQTITPGTTNKTIASGRYLTGTQTIKGDANLVPTNIVKGVSIFGVVGTADTSGGTGGSEEKTACALSLIDHTYTNPAAQYTDENGEPTVTSIPTYGMDVTSFVGDNVTIFLPDAPDFFTLNAEGVAQRYFGGAQLGSTIVGMLIFEITGETAAISVETGGDI